MFALTGWIPEQVPVHRTRPSAAVRASRTLAWVGRVAPRRSVRGCKHRPPPQFRTDGADFRPHRLWERMVRGPPAPARAHAGTRTHRRGRMAARGTLYRAP